MFSNTYITRRWLTSITWYNFKCNTTTSIFLKIRNKIEYFESQKNDKRTSICCKYCIGWLETGCPLISLISSPTCNVPCRCIIPPLSMRDTIHRLFSVIRSVIPLMRKRRFFDEKKSHLYFLPMVHQYFVEIEQVEHVLHHMLSHSIHHQRLHLIRHHSDHHNHDQEQHLMLMYYYQDKVV